LYLLSVLQIPWWTLCAMAGLAVGFFAPLFLYALPATLVFFFVLDFTEDRGNAIKLATELVFALVWALALAKRARLRMSFSVCAFLAGALLSGGTLAVASLCVWLGVL
jgi:hypothetical protein